MNRIISFFSDLDKQALRSFAMLLLAVVAVSAVFWASAKIIGIDEHGLLARTFRALADSPWALPAVIAAYTASSFIGAPQFILIAITVAAFGPVKGFVFSYLATLVSGSVNFHMARYLGADWLRRRNWKIMNNVSKAVSRNDFFAAMLVRVVPSAPFIVVNMGLGLTQSTYLAFLAGTAIGIIPKTALIALLGKTVEQAGAGDPTAIAYLVLAALLWLALAVVTKRLMRRRGAAEP